MTHAYALLRPGGRVLRPRGPTGLVGRAVRIGAEQDSRDGAKPTLARQTIAERCVELGVRLTEKRRRLVDLLDQVPTPIDLDETWWKAKDLGFDVNRSSLHRLAADLVAIGVLNEIASPDRRRRFATPAPITVEVQAADGAPRALDDARLSEMLIEILSANGMGVSGRRVVIHLED